MFGLLVVRGLLIGLGYLLIIPGIISTYKYMLAPFILVDNPDMSVKECLKKSSDLVSGKKWSLFVLCISYIGWLIVAYIVGFIIGQFIPFGTTIALAVVQVYMYVGIAHFYLNNSGQDNTINMKLNANIISLINKLYAIQKSEDVLYEKIYENYTKNEINKIFENNVPVPKIINEIEKMINSNKYQTLMNEFNKERYIQISFVLPFINKFSNDKFLFNCSDSIQFRDNYTSILNFINKYNIENIPTSIQNFLQMFSFFTYFQYVQNDISSRLLSIVELDMKKEKDNFAIISGCISNYLKIIKDYTSGNIFIKNLPNFLNFILQCSIFITQIVHNFEESSELLKIYHNALNDTLNFEIAGKDKEKIDNYYKILNQYNEYFMHGDFKKSIEDIAKREMFICKEEKERSSILNEINNICSSITPITAQK